MENFCEKKCQIVLRELGVGSQGLSEEEVRRRFKEYGPNELPQGEKRGWKKIFFSQFKSPLIYILLLAAFFVILIGEWGDAIVIAFVLILNSVIGTIQEGKAQNTFLALRKLVKSRAMVIRDGQEVIISDRNLVPGDILILKEGEKIPADARIIEAEFL
ncbi:MAG: cation-transporting P-type ATPase, partial [Patescibacteria group bacterium]